MMAKRKPRETKMLKCLKRCMFREDRKSHEKHEGTPGGDAFLESKEHTDELLGRCVPRCTRRKKRRK
jgi:hypothetical protein